MKKLFFTLGLACIFMVACNNTPKQQEEQPAEQPAETTEVVEEKHECPMQALKEEFANWENLEETAKADLIAKATSVFADMEAKRAEMEAQMEGEAKEACEKMAEMTEEQKAECEAKCAEMKAKWDNFDNLTLDEQKDLVMERLNGCGGEKKCCNKEEAPAEPAE